MNEVHSIHSLSNEAFGWYVSGFTDGEGCFYLTSRKGRHGQCWTAGFRIALRIDDRAILNAIAQRLKCGAVRVYNPSANTDRPGTNPQARWFVSSLRELADVIVPHFESYPLQAKKARDFSIWKHAVVLMGQAALRKRRRIPGQRGGFFPMTTPEEQAFIADIAVWLKSSRNFDAYVVNEEYRLSRQQ